MSDEHPYHYDNISNAVATHPGEINALRRTPYFGSYHDERRDYVANLKDAGLKGRKLRQIHDVETVKQDTAHKHEHAIDFELLVPDWITCQQKVSTDSRIQFQGPLRDP